MEKLNELPDAEQKEKGFERLRELDEELGKEFSEARIEPASHNVPPPPSSSRSSIERSTSTSDVSE